MDSLSALCGAMVLQPPVNICRSWSRGTRIFEKDFFLAKKPLQPPILNYDAVSGNSCKKFCMWARNCGNVRITRGCDYRLDNRNKQVAM